LYESSTQAIPDAQPVPRHIAIIMDGNGRWARRRHLPRVAGHRKGGDAVRATVRACAERGVEYLMIGELSRFSNRIQTLIAQAQRLTEANRQLTLTVAANYGGRWDLMQGVKRMLAARPELAHGFEEQDLAPYLALNYGPEPDLFIRTGGEQRISNFLLWQLAYTELYFTDTLWPDFDAAALDQAIRSYRTRERRFGRTSEQLATDLAQGRQRVSGAG
jgi:undecaprenyl diphosphate synthase